MTMMKKDFASILNQDTNKDFALLAKYETISERARLLYVGICFLREKS